MVMKRGITHSAVRNGQVLHNLLLQYVTRELRMTRQAILAPRGEHNSAATAGKN